MDNTVILSLALSVVMTGAMVAFFFAIISRWAKGRRTAVVTENEMLSTRHRCPKCGVGMKPGFAIASRGLLWREAGSTAKNMLYGKFEPLTNTMNWTMTPRFNRAWRCEQCEYVLLDASAMVNVRKGETTDG